MSFCDKKAQFFAYVTAELDFLDCKELDCKFFMIDFSMSKTLIFDRNFFKAAAPKSLDNYKKFFRSKYLIANFFGAIEIFSQIFPAKYLGSHQKNFRSSISIGKKFDNFLDN